MIYLFDITIYTATLPDPHMLARHEAMRITERGLHAPQNGQGSSYSEPMYEL